MKAKQAIVKPKPVPQLEKHAYFCPPTEHDTKLDQLNKAIKKQALGMCFKCILFMIIQDVLLASALLVLQWTSHFFEVVIVATCVMNIFPSQKKKKKKKKKKKFHTHPCRMRHHRTLCCLLK